LSIRSEEGLEDGKRTESGEGREVETVVLEDAVQDLGTFEAGESVEGHVFVVKAEKTRKGLAFVLIEVVGMRGDERDEDGVGHIEIVTGLKGFDMREDTEIAKQSGKKNKVEVSDALRTVFKNMDGAVKIVEKRRVRLVFAEDAVEKFGQKEGKHVLGGVSGEGRRRKSRAAFADTVQFVAETSVNIHFELGERNEESARNNATTPTATCSQTSYAAASVGVQMNDVVTIVVRNDVQDNAAGRHGQSLSLALMNSRLRRAMLLMETDFGHSASQARVLVQLPKPNSSILAIIALARRAASIFPCGSKAS
jgi:hypothetical protein